LVVDLTSRSSRADDVDLPGRLGLGGKVLGVRLLERYLDPATEPLVPENVVVIAPSLLAGYAMSGSNRFGAFTRSPLTGIWLESYCGGTFARNFRETGWDALVLKGAADAPTHLHITRDGAELLAADDFWGKNCFAVEAELLSRLAKRSSVLCIGVAGEKMVKVASVMHQRSHSLGRGGLGAVFGSKSLKALTVSSPGPMKLPVEDHFAGTRKEVAALAADSPTTTTYRRFGTPVMVSVVNEAGAFPTDFFLKGRAPHRETLEAERWPEWAEIHSENCPPCAVRCRKRLTFKEGPETGRELHAPEFETIYTFGGSCMVEEAADVARLNELCNILGLDTMSTGNLVAAAIKAGELGLLDDVPTAGEVEGISRLLSEIATRSTPVGEALAQGLDEALADFGMSEWSITSKRLDPAGYEPRRLRSMALSYALSVRGACHLRATYYKAELGGLLTGLDDDAFVQTYIDWEDRMLISDSLTLCRFYRDFMTWDRLVSCVSQLNGSPVAKEDLERLSADTISRIRRLNFAFGATPADDTVAPRFFEEPTDTAPALHRDELERRIGIYWAKRGWTEAGLVPAVTR
jgi:aldehyde:ferredoxin oxidoreductase